MRKLTHTVLAVLMVLATTGMPNARERINEIGTVTQDSPLYRHHWDVKRKVNLQCTAKKGHTVRAVNKITWLDGLELIHLRYNSCNGWTLQSNFKRK